MSCSVAIESRIYERKKRHEKTPFGSSLQHSFARCAVGSLTVPLASAYSDVTRSAFPDYFDAINYVTDNGLMNGTSSTQFEPNSFLSRAMLVGAVWHSLY